MYQGEYFKGRILVSKTKCKGSNPFSPVNKLGDKPPTINQQLLISRARGADVLVGGLSPSLLISLQAHPRLEIQILAGETAEAG